jgi:hypothetical protein
MIQMQIILLYKVFDFCKKSILFECDTIPLAPEVPAHLTGRLRTELDSISLFTTVRARTPYLVEVDSFHTTV